MTNWHILPRPTPAGAEASEGRDKLGEGITYVAADNALYWVDILGQRIHRYGFADASYAEWPTPEMIGWLLPRADAPGFIAGLASGIYALSLTPFALTPIAAPEAHLPGNRFNDACVDAKGRIWAGTMRMDAAKADGALYRLNPDLSCQLVDAPYRIANGPAFSPDGRYLYHTDSAAGEVYRFACHDDGSLGPRQPFITFAPGWGAPDGMTVDAEGGIWIAHWGGGCVSRFTPEGQRESWIGLPASQITKPCFAGADYRRLFVTSAADGVDEAYAGAVFEVDPGCAGLAPHRFGQ